MSIKLDSGKMFPKREPKSCSVAEEANGAEK